MENDVSLLDCINISSESGFEFLLIIVSCVWSLLSDFLNAQVIVAIVALYLTWSNFYRKHGTRVKGCFISSTGWDSDGSYISGVVLENLKDKPVTVYGIYIDFAGSYLLELEDLRDLPIIIKPYQALVRDYQAPFALSVNMNSVNIEKLLSNNKIKKRIILSTSDGRYVVRQIKDIWIPVLDVFSYKIFGLVHVFYLKVDGKNVGGGTAYVLKFVCLEGIETSFVYSAQRNFSKYGLALEADDLVSLESVKKKIAETEGKGGLVGCFSVKAYSVEEAHGEGISWVKENGKYYFSERDIKPRYVPLRIYTLLKKFIVQFWYGDKGKRKL